MSLDSNTQAHNNEALDPTNVLTNAAASIAGANDNASETGAEGGTERPASDAADHADDSTLDQEDLLDQLPASLRGLLQPVKRTPPPRPVQAIEKADLLSLIDDAGVALENLADKVETYIKTQNSQLGHDYHAAGRPDNFEPGNDFIKAAPDAWCGVSLVSLKTGLMQLRRAVEQPTGF